MAASERREKESAVAVSLMVAYVTLTCLLPESWSSWVLLGDATARPHSLARLGSFAGLAIAVFASIQVLVTLPSLAASLYRRIRRGMRVQPSGADILPWCLLAVLLASRWLLWPEIRSAGENRWYFIAAGFDAVSIFVKCILVGGFQLTWLLRSLGAPTQLDLNKRDMIKLLVVTAFVPPCLFVAAVLLMAISIAARGLSPRMRLLLLLLPGVLATSEGSRKELPLLSIFVGVVVVVELVRTKRVSTRVPVPLVEVVPDPLPAAAFRSARVPAPPPPQPVAKAAPVPDRPDPQVVASTRFILDRALSDPSTDVRCRAALALGAVGDVTHIPRLLNLVAQNEEAREVRLAALSALERLADESGHAALAALPLEEDLAVRWRRRAALERIATGVVPPPQDAMIQPKPMVRVIG